MWELDYKEDWVPKNWCFQTVVLEKTFETPLDSKEIKPDNPQFSSVQSLSHVQLFATPWTAACQASLSITNSRSLLKLMSIKLVMPSNHLILCLPFLLLPSSLPASGSFLMSRLFASGGQSIGVSASKSVLPRTPRTDFERMHWLDLLAVQATLKSLLQHHSSKASILWHSAFFMVQLSHPYMTTGKTLALTIWTFVGEVMSAFCVCVYFF